MAEIETQKIDPETEFLASKRETGTEWETFKENVRPLKRGRNVNILNHALKCHTDNYLKKSLIQQRRKLIEAIDDYKGEDPLLPWLECMKWVQEAFPPGGDSSGLVVIYEQCVRAFWHSERYKEDLRYLKVWLEYAENCFDKEVIYSFLDANEIGKTHSDFYISYALHLESKNKFKAANQTFELGINRNAQPIEKLKAAYRKFLVRSMSRTKPIDDPVEKEAPVRSFGTLLAKGDNGAPLAPLSSNRSSKPLAPLNSNLSVKNDRTRAAPLSIYKDSNANAETCPPQPDPSHSWLKLGGRAERNKENNAIPAKWKSFKVPQRPGTRATVVGASACIPVFVDEEYQGSLNPKAEGKSSNLKTRQDDEKDLKRETELLRKDPLRNFPHSSLPR
ncbi:putative mitotic spindle checkpoint protein Bub1/Mad3 [Medicago truncatula]|uniref:Inactive Serine/Threonine-kinase BUB1-like protein, putative n=1 Tax=Medicago truncatula TaxID=3880 RepID=G7IA28_MEDTR|nr:mitotic spindle checkpoint protein BUBR1 [Medicago truncatula]AES59939.1 inactive Serine/Threonine-kinase BUB1-like protein, putative [Medicago truncatula]RHN78192.1 putative mitotic spindle checkpoint protein Bub1/Mad3 [Medicago truncatula]